MARNLVTSEGLINAYSFPASDGNAGETFKTDGAGAVTWVKDSTSDLYTGEVSNLGITYASNTFTITSAGGTALSATNYGTVVLPSKTPGLLKQITISADQSFIDDGAASTIINNYFGMGIGVTAASAFKMPFYIYAVINDAETAVSFMVSRVPSKTTSPITANIGKTGSASAVSNVQSTFFALGDPTITDYDENPCLAIGSFTMKLTAVEPNPDWTVQTLTNADGIGMFNEETEFSMNPETFGAPANSFFLGGTTQPTWTANYTYNYFISLRGMVKLRIYIGSSPAADGVGAATLFWTLPYATVSGITHGNANLVTETTPVAGTSAINLNISSANASMGYVNTTTSTTSAGNDVHAVDFTAANFVSFGSSTEYKMNDTDV